MLTLKQLSDYLTQQRLIFRFSLIRSRFYLYRMQRNILTRKNQFRPSFWTMEKG